MVRRIGVVTVARSDYGHLMPVLEQIRDADDLSLVLFAAAGYLSERLGGTVRAIEADGWSIAERAEMRSDSDAPEDLGAAAGAGLAGFARAFARQRPDLVLVLGDRLEMLRRAVIFRLELAAGEQPSHARADDGENLRQAASSSIPRGW